MRKPSRSVANASDKAVAVQVDKVVVVQVADQVDRAVSVQRAPTCKSQRLTSPHYKAPVLR